MKKRILVSILLVAVVLAAVCALAACDKTVVRDVTIASSPAKTNYYIGDSFDPAGCTLLVAYTDGQVKSVDVTADMASDFVAAKTGPYTITITYAEGKQTFTLPLTLHVVARPPMRLEIATPPTCSDYVVGQPISIKGLQLHAYYTQTDVRTVDASALTYTTVTAQSDTTSVRVGYEGLWIDVPITVSPVRHTSLTAVVVDTETLWQYEVLYGYQLAFYYVNNDGSLSPTEYVDVDKMGTRLMQAGPTKLGLSITDEDGTYYEGEATVEVMPNALVGVRVADATYAYTAGDAYTTDKLTLDLQFAHSQWAGYSYADGTIEGLTTTLAAGTVLAVAGVQEVGFTLDGTPISGTYRVCVDTVAVVRLDATLQQVVRTYKVGDVARPDNLLLYAVSSDGTRVQIWNRNIARAEGVTLSGPLQAEDTVAYVYYDGLFHAYPVIVLQ